jgi:hypothetical protein
VLHVSKDTGQAVNYVLNPTVVLHELLGELAGRLLVGDGSSWRRRNLLRENDHVGNPLNGGQGFPAPMVPPTEAALLWFVFDLAREDQPSFRSILKLPAMARFALGLCQLFGRLSFAFGYRERGGLFLHGGDS